MPTITKKQYDDYKKLCYDREHGRIITPDGLRFVCEANNYEPEAIGKHFLEVLGRIHPNKNHITNNIERQGDSFSLPFLSFYAVILHNLCCFIL